MTERFSEKLATDRRTYFFDVKETREGSMYLVISERTQQGSEVERHRVMVFEENIDAFLIGLRNAARHMNGHDGSEHDYDEENVRPVIASNGSADHAADDLRAALGNIQAGIDDIRRSLR